MRRLGVVAALVAALAFAFSGACTTSALRSTDPVTIRGAVTSGGAGVTGRTVLVRKSLSADELSGRMQAALSAVQLACVADHPPGACRRAHYAHTARSGPDGAFELRLTGRDTQSALGIEASLLQIAVAGPPGSDELSGPATSEALHVQVADLQTPPLGLWAAAPVFTPLPGGVRVSWPPLPAELGASPVYRVLFDDGADGLVWDSGPLGGRTVYDLDARILEDIDGGVSVLATAEGQVSRSAVAFAYRTPRRHVRSTLAAPPSRGRPCTIVLGAAGDGASGLSPCGLTDGRFDPPALASVLRAQPSRAGPPPAPCPPAPTRPPCAESRGSAVVDLGRAVTPSLFVVRGCPAACAVESSVDGTAWTAVGTADGPDAALPATPNPAPARFVRLAGPVSDLASVTELSVWPPVPAVRAADPTVRLVPGRPRSGSSGSRSRRLALAAASLLAAGVIGAIAFLFGRGRLRHGRVRRSS